MIKELKLKYNRKNVSVADNTAHYIMLRPRSRTTGEVQVEQEQLTFLYEIIHSCAFSSVLV